MAQALKLNIPGNQENLTACLLQVSSSKSRKSDYLKRLFFSIRSCCRRMVGGEGTSPGHSWQWRSDLQLQCEDIFCPLEFHSSSASCWRWWQTVLFEHIGHIYLRPTLQTSYCLQYYTAGLAFLITILFSSINHVTRLVTKGVKRVECNYSGVPRPAGTLNTALRKCEHESLFSLINRA